MIEVQILWLAELKVVPKCKISFFLIAKKGFFAMVFLIVLGRHLMNFKKTFIAASNILAIAFNLKSL